MQIGRIENATRVLGKAQEYRGLPVRDGVLACLTGGTITPVMRSAWLPTPAELARLAAGAPVYLTLLGTKHPPVTVIVGDPPVPEQAGTP